MTVSEWVRQSIDNIWRNGSDGVRRAGSDLAVGLKKRYWEYRKPGVDIYDLEWDLLVILDACRVDVLNEVSSEYDFLPDSVSSISSVGRLSEEWIDTTFSQASVGEVSETAYITGNPHTDRLLDPSDFTLLDEVWRYNWDDDTGTTPAPPTY